jgi:hypothetical protein
VPYDEEDAGEGGEVGFFALSVSTGANMKLRPVYLFSVLSCFVLILFSSTLSFAYPIKKLARHYCYGEEVVWKEFSDPELLKYVDHIESVFAQLAYLGDCKSYKYTGKKITLKYEDADVIVKVNAGGKGVEGIFFSGAQYRNDSFDKVAKSLRKLPGQVAVSVKRGDGKILFSQNPDLRLATGSSFKLYILKALLEDIDMGKRSWSDLIELDERKYSLPSGVLHEWPSGSPVTLHTLATLMISISDNTATDILIDEVGRERLEGMMPGSVPFLKTKEMFIIKWADRGLYRKRYLKSYLSGKRRILMQIASYNLSKLKPPPLEPIDPDKIEWFASTDELADLILKMKDEPILAVNPGLIDDSKKWSYVGYKGGSEPGVIQYTQLLKSKSGKWYAISASWNNLEMNVDHDLLGSVVLRLADLL